MAISAVFWEDDGLGRCFEDDDEGQDEEDERVEEGEEADGFVRVALIGRVLIITFSWCLLDWIRAEIVCGYWRLDIRIWLLKGGLRVL